MCGDGGGQTKDVKGKVEERIESKFLMRWALSMTMYSKENFFEGHSFDQANLVQGNIKILRNKPARDNFHTIFFGACQHNDMKSGA